MTLYPFNSPIAKKLVWWFVVISTSVALFSTGVQLYLDYRVEVNRIHSYLASLDETYLPSIAKNTWLMDDNQINTLLEGITNRDDIVYASISIDDSVRWSSGLRTDIDRIQVELPIHYLSRNTREHIGTLTVRADLEDVYEQLTRRGLVVLISNFIKTFIVAAMALVVVQYLITRHLQAMATHVSRISFNPPSSQLQLDRTGKDPPDELDAVTDALSLMQARAQTAYQDLSRSEKQLRLFLDSTAEGVFGVDANGIILYANTKCYQLLKLSNRHDLIGKQYTDLFVWRSPHIDHHSLLDTIREGNSLISEDSFITCTDQSEFNAAIRAYPTFTQKTFSGAIVFFTDTSEQRKTMHLMELLKEALDTSPLSILITDDTRSIVYVNPEFEQITGYRLEEIEGTSIDRYSAEEPLNQIYLTTTKNALRGVPWEGKVRFTAKNGSSRVADVVTSPVVNERGQVTNLVALSRDVTYEEELHNHLITYQKQEALGRLSASIAHEFGNPLFGVRALLKDFCDRSLPTSEDRQLIEIGIKECERMQQLINDINNFYGAEKTVTKQCDITEIIDKILYFQQKNLLDNNIVLTVQHASSLPKINAKEDQLGQAVLNLVLNGVDAMKPGGGELSIVTSLEQGFISIGVSDTGIGVKASLLDQIFEPFFSTKHEVEGTGLGLSVAYGIVTNHGGKLVCDSTEGQGSTFTILLPVAEGEGIEHPPSAHG